MEKLDLTQTTLYASVLAKMGVERSQLLSETKQKALTQTKNLTELVNQLHETSYQTQIAKLTPPLTSRKLERAFTENLIETEWKIFKNSPREVQAFVGLYLVRFEVENIKLLIKATNAKLTPEQKLAKIYLAVEEYLKHRSLFEEAAKAPSIRQTVGVFKDSEYASVLKIGFGSFEEAGSTTCLDVLLDKHFYDILNETYQDLPNKEKPHVYPYVSLEVDGFVLLTLLRGKNLKYDPHWLRLAVPSKRFNLSEDTVEAIVLAQDFDSALKTVLKTSYRRFFIKPGSPEETMRYAEEELQKALFIQAKKSRFTEIFNVGAVLAFLAQKQAEVHNLTAIGLGVVAGLKPEDVERQLLL